MIGIWLLLRGKTEMEVEKLQFSGLLKSGSTISVAKSKSGVLPTVRCLSFVWCFFCGATPSIKELVTVPLLPSLDSCWKATKFCRLEPSLLMAGSYLLLGLALSEMFVFCEAGVIKNISYNCHLAFFFTSKRSLKAYKNILCLSVPPLSYTFSDLYFLSDFNEYL